MKEKIWTHLNEQKGIEFIVQGEGFLNFKDPFCKTTFAVPRIAIKTSQIMPFIFQTMSLNRCNDEKN